MGAKALFGLCIFLADDCHQGLLIFKLRLFLDLMTEIQTNNAYVFPAHAKRATLESHHLSAFKRLV